MWPLLFLVALTAVNAFSPRIIGGSNTTIDKYPYQVSIHYDKFECGGSIISRNWVLTAAHCVYGKVQQRIRVRVQSSYKVKGGTLISSVKSIRIHDLYKYTSDGLFYDVALIELPSPIQLSANAKPIALADSKSVIQPGSKAVVTGWGLTSVDGSWSDTLQVLTMPVVDQKTCKKIFNKYKITDAMLCAGSMAGNQDVCRGDSGGPLAYNDVQIGIVSWGYKCAEKGFPGVYTRVSDPTVRSWIRREAKV